MNTLFNSSLVGQLQLADVLAVLATDRPVFHSEADFQHHLAWVVRQLDETVQIRLETRPIPDLGLELDLLLVDPSSGDRVAVELKYATRALQVDHCGERFNLRNQAAQDVRRHDFIKDIVRIETLVDRGAVGRGWAIFLTNDAGFWRASSRETVDTAFRLHDGRALPRRLVWTDAAGEGTRRGRDMPLELSGAYELGWRDFSTAAQGPGGTFRILPVAVDPMRPSADSISVPSPSRATTPQAQRRTPDTTRFAMMIDELREMRDQCEPKNNSNPTYLRYSNAISALKWLSASDDGAG